MGSTSILTLSTFTTDRFIAVFSHLRYAEIVTSRRVGIALLIIWVYSIASWFIFHFITERFINFQEAVVFVAILLNVYFLIRINRCVHRHVVQIQAQQQAAQQTMNIQTLKKSINPMYYMFGAFVFWTFPSYTSAVVLNVLGDRRVDLRILVKVCELLFLLNSLANPVIYFWRIKALRTESINFLSGIWQKIIYCFS